MDKALFELYARFVVRSGVNVQKGQTLIISSPIEAAPFARQCAAEAYAAGARDVVMRYNDEKFSRIRLEQAGLDALTDVKPWELASYMDYYDGGPSVCRLAIYAEDPEAYKGLDVAKVEKAMQARSKVLKPWSDLSMVSRIQWCVVSVPTEAWAAKVFAGQKPEDAVEKLWAAIFKATRVEGGAPEAAWEAHAEASTRRVEALNALGLAALHLEGENGTDLTVGLVDDYVFEGIPGYTPEKVRFFANVPSEEVFTAPHRSRVDGVVKSSLPYVYNGNLIEGITARFEKGVAVEVRAEKGDELLQQMMSADEGARRLGEIALVPASSPIRQSGLLYYNTLFDENAACHMAFGEGYPTCVKGGAAMSREELDAKGLNDSLIHEDIMIGTPGMNITGITADGRRVPVFKAGEWAL